MQQQLTCFDFMQIISALQFLGEEDQKWQPSTPASIKSRPSQDPFSPPTLLLQQAQNFNLEESETQCSSFSSNTLKIENELSKIEIRSRSQSQDFSILGFLQHRIKQNKNLGRLRLRSSELDGNLREENLDC